MFEVLDGGAETTVQDYPGRLGYYYLGIPPSGPFDSLAFRLANLLVGNPVGEAALEITLLGPKLRFLEEAAIALTGADLSPTLNRKPIPMRKTLKVESGDLLSFGFCKSGCRTYLAIAGGIDVPVVFGSKSTYLKGLLGGVDGRKLMKGDIIKTGPPRVPLERLMGRGVKPEVIPKHEKEWDIRVVLGPNDDYLEDEFLLEMYALGRYPWKVSSMHDRVGVRLIGPEQRWKPADRRPPSGAHPSNINLVSIPVGTINVCGETPIPTGADAISLTGFTSVATIISADMWKLGQVKAGDTIRFKAVTLEEARKAREELEKLVNEKSLIVK